MALGLMGGIICGADKLSRVAYLRSDAALPEVLGIEAVASQSTLSRFLDGFDEAASNALNGLPQWAMGRLPSLSGGSTLDLDSWSLWHRDGPREGETVSAFVKKLAAGLAGNQAFQLSRSGHDPSRHQPPCHSPVL